jgi:hypothetical protein
MRKPSGAFILLLAAAAAALGQRPLAAGTLEEGQVKAAFLLNFAKFVQWPAASAGPLVIGVTGDDGLGEIVERTVRDRMVSGRPVMMKRMTPADDPDDCHILYIAGARAREAAEILQRVSGPVLTIGETVQFVRDGGMVRFFVENNRMRFHINQKNAEAAGLKVSSQLLNLAAR